MDCLVHLLPNAAGSNHIFTIAGNQVIIWDYTKNQLIKTLPNTPLHPRTFPSSATSVLLPLRAPDYQANILLCGGSSGARPNPKALQDCYNIHACDEKPTWMATDSLPNGPQTMSVSTNTELDSLKVHHRRCAHAFSLGRSPPP